MLDLDGYFFSFVTGKGEDMDEITAFSAACLDAGLGHTNLFELVSGVLPPGCEERQGAVIGARLIVPAVFASISRHRVDGLTAKGFISPRIGAAVAIAIPEDPKFPGVITKCSDETYGEECEVRAQVTVQRAMEIREIPVKEIKSIAVEFDDIKYWGSVVAAVIFFK